MSELSHFAERGGVVPCVTSWGQWYQTVEDITIEVNLTPGTKGKEIQVTFKSKAIKCVVRGETIFEGPLYGMIHPDDSLWTIEDQKLLRIVLSRADDRKREIVWESLLENDYKADPLTLHNMRKKMDLEKFQIENPGFDFSGAELQKSYDKVPGME